MSKNEIFIIESSKYWLSVLNELKNRDLEEKLIITAHNLNGHIINDPSKTYDRQFYLGVDDYQKK